MGRTVRNQRSDRSPLPRVNVRKLDTTGVLATMLVLDTAEFFDIVNDEEDEQDEWAHPYRGWDWPEDWRIHTRRWRDAHRGGCGCRLWRDPADRVVDCGGVVCGATEDDWLQPPPSSWRHPDLETEFGECGICAERETLLRTGCGSYSARYVPHQFCGDCLRGWIGSKLDESCVLIKCPHEGCKTTLTFASIERIAGPEAFDRFLALAERDYTAKSDEILKDPLLSKWAEDHMKQCPNCRQLVERSEGCAHISCVCGADWCYNCEQFLEDCGDGCYDSDYSYGDYVDYGDYDSDEEGVDYEEELDAYNNDWIRGELTDLALMAKEQRDCHTSSAIRAKFRRQQRQGKKAGARRQDRGMAGGGRKTSQRNWSANTVPRVHRMRLAADI